MFAFFSAAAQSGNLEEDNSPKADRPPPAAIGRCGTNWKDRCGLSSTNGISELDVGGVDAAPRLHRYVGPFFRLVVIVCVTCGFVNKVLFALLLLKIHLKKTAPRALESFTQYETVNYSNACHAVIPLPALKEHFKMFVQTEHTELPYLLKKHF